MAQTAGIKIAQPGYDANKCADYNLIFSSSWPSIQILYDVTFSYNNYPTGTTVTSFTDPTGFNVTRDVITYPINPGFFAFTQAWLVQNGVELGRIPIDVYANKIVIDIYWSTNQAQTKLTAGQSINVKVYNVNLQYQQSYEYTQPSPIAQPYDSAYGIKIAKNNKGINDKDLRSFVLHSRAASPQVLSVVTEKSLTNYDPTVGGTLSYLIPKNYIPWAFGYQAYQNVSYYLYNNEMIYTFVPYYSTGTTHLYVYTSGNADNPKPRISMALFGSSINPTFTGMGTMICLRDPLFVSQNVQVNY